MKKATLMVVAGTVIGLGASLAAGHPTDVIKHGKKRGPMVKKINEQTPQAAGFEDNFDSYKTGSTIAGQGGWEVWYNTGNDAVLSDDTATSAPNSLKLGVQSDIVHQFDGITSGQWVMTIQTYVPSGQTADGYFILLNEYVASPGFADWSVQVQFSPSQGTVDEDFDPFQNTQPIVFDAWVEYRAEIDLDGGVYSDFYGGGALGVDVLWDDNGTLEIAATDLYSNDIDPMYFDDFSLVPAGGDECYPDFTGDGFLDLFDFLGFVNAFNAGDPKANCDGVGGLDLFDFLCFVNAFNAGC